MKPNGFCAQMRFNDAPRAEDVRPLSVLREALVRKRRNACLSRASPEKGTQGPPTESYTK